MASVVQSVFIQGRLLVQGAFTSFGLELGFMDDHFKPLNHLLASVHLYGAILIKFIHIVVVVVGIALVFAFDCKDSIVIFIHQVEIDSAML